MTGVARLRSNKALLGGLLMLLLGLWAAAQGSFYKVGTLRSMGPGFFPVSLGVILACLGVVMAVEAVRAAPAQSDRAELDPNPSDAGPEWRGWFCLCLGILLFILLGRYGGVLPATFAVVFVSALGDRRNSVRDATLLGAAAVAVALGVFSYGLKIQFPLLGWG